MNYLKRVLAGQLLYTILIGFPGTPLVAKEPNFFPLEPAKSYGSYFEVEKTRTSLPTFDASKKALPQPILEGNPEWIEMYWTCWEIAFGNLKNPEPDSPLVSPWLDEAFRASIFQWDTIFMMMFARYAHEVFPMIQSLDNFYARQRPSGYICRQIAEDTGKEEVFRTPADAINPPLFAWAEVESYRLTGDKSRFARVLPVLEKYAEWLNRDGDPNAENWEANGRISKGTPHRLYWNTNMGSGMDDSPRPTEKGCGNDRKINVSSYLSVT